MSPPVSNRVRTVPPPTPPLPGAVAPAASKAPNPNEWADFFGDKFDALVPKDGYLRFEVKEDPKGVRYPDRIRLADGRVATVKPGPEANQFTIKAGNHTLIATREQGTLTFVEPRPRGTAMQGDLIGYDGRAYRPVREPNDLARVFNEAYQVANDVKPARLDPVTQKKAESAALDAAAPKTKAEADQLARSLARLTKDASNAANELGAQLSKLEELKAHGNVSITQDDEGRLKLELRRPSGTSDGEWAKLQRRFGPRLELFAMDLEDLREKATSAAASRDQAAGVLLRKLESPELKKMLGDLPQPKRLEQFNKLAAGLVGTSYGDELANRLFGSGSGRAVEGSGGVLKPQPGSVAEIVLQGAYGSPEAKGQLKNLALAMAPHLPDKLGMKIPSMVSERLFELTLGRPLTKDEAKAAQELAGISKPEQLEHLVHPEGPSGKVGLAGELLGKLGEAPEHSYLLGNVPRGKELLHSASPALRAGAALFTTFAAGQAWSALMKHGLTPETAGEVAEATTRAVGSYAEIAHHLGMGGEWMSKVAKGSGVASSAFGVMLDVGKAYGAESPDRRDHYVGEALLSGTILVATIADAPMVAAGAIVWKLLGPDAPSESYDQAYGRLERGVPEAK